jgi:hypothetical protein
MSKKIFMLLLLALLLTACTAPAAPAAKPATPAAVGNSNQNASQNDDQNLNANLNENRNTNTALDNSNVNGNTNTNAPAGAGLANPASVNCETLNGRLVLEHLKAGDKELGVIGVCYFEDNRQCEEWALFRGECPAGGVKVTGYATEAGRYCAITGGSYRVTKESPDYKKEEGTCGKNGQICDAFKYFSGDCQL